MPRSCDSDRKTQGTANFISYKFNRDLGALSIAFELVIGFYGLNESKYPVLPLFSAILVTPEAFKGQPLQFLVLSLILNVVLIATYQRFMKLRLTVT